MSRNFQRKIENFVCEHCGTEVEGNGYTNHCPCCLWSKHVDKNPGDRENECQGLMRPVSAFFQNGVWRIVHKCEKCGGQKTNKICDEDDLEVLQEIIRQSVK